MLPLEDKLWQEISPGPLGIAEVPSYLSKLFSGNDEQEVWEMFWSILHHQGDVDDASYAAVPHLLQYIEQSEVIDANAVGLIATIESCRPHNIPPRQEIAEDYFDAIRMAPVVLAKHPHTPWSDEVTAASIWLLSLSKGNTNYGILLDHFNVTNAQGWVEDNEVFKWVEQ